MSGSINWSRHSLEELAELYWSEIAPALRRAGYDPHQPPSYRTLGELGYSGIEYTLREHHDLGPKEFFVDVVDLEDDTTADAPGFEWGIEDEETLEALQTYLRRRSRRKWSDATADTVRARLARYARIYADIHGTADLLSLVESEDDRQEGRRKALAVFDVFDEELSTDASKLKYLGDVSGWYDWLSTSGRAAYSPLANAAHEFDWERSEPDNAALEAADVAALVDAAERVEEHLLVVGLCAWGLRPNELAKLHTSNLVLDPHEGPEYLSFDERKNGPGTVTMVFGVRTLEERIDELAADRTWAGYLFPSTQSSSGHVIAETIANRFRALAERAGVTVHGETPSAKMGRRFWYSTYASAKAAVLDDLDDIAEEQGSSSAEVVYRNYLSESERRGLRRKHMREALAEAFE